MGLHLYIFFYNLLIDFLSNFIEKPFSIYKFSMLISLTFSPINICNINLFIHR